MLFEKSKWIWTNSNPQADEYGEFFDSFEYNGKSLILNISCDSNYAVYLNGEFAAFGQYADFPYDKIYDSVDITKYAKQGKNTLAIRVWYYGITTSSCYYKGNAGLLYECVADGCVVSASDENILSRKSIAYVNHRVKCITGQMGLAYKYDMTKEDNWINGEICGFDKSVIVPQDLPLRIRPCKKLELLNLREGKLIKTFGENDLLFDMGINEVGFLSFSITSDCEQNINISYGEHIADGKVRGQVGGRDFSADFVLRAGENKFENTFRRFGAKYLEIVSEHPVKVNYIGLLPTMYPITMGEYPNLSENEKKIYDACVRTLRLCMHEHYEDCPWREQALYTMDSRNQMLAGYYAFNEYEFPRANLELMSKDKREDGLLSICTPINMDLVIPSFSLHYYTSCLEYLERSGDKEFIKSIYGKLESVLNVFIKRMDNGIVYPFGETGFEHGNGMIYWNFYEWESGLEGYGVDTSKADLPLNAFFSIALQKMGKMSQIIGYEDKYSIIAESVNKAINERFYNEETGLYVNREGDMSSILTNSLAILCGACDNEKAKKICEKMTCENNGMTPISLSMQCFFFDALLASDFEKYKPYILKSIEDTYMPMVEYGVGTVWETVLGESDFANAGSLCHGWSAMPIYYYFILK